MLASPGPLEEQARKLALRVLGGAFAIALAFAALLASVKALRAMNVGSLWDDAYIFQRYAGNFLAEHRVSWNPHGEPTYGMTTPAFLAVTAPILAVCRGNPALSALLASAIPGFAFLGLMGVLMLRHTDVPRAPRRAALGLVALVIALSNTPDHFASGMDTTFGLAFAVVYLIAASRLSRAPSRARAVTLGVLGGLTYWVRPEMLLYAALVPAAQMALGGDRAARRAGAEALLVTALTVGVELGICQLYFGSALPLPFYAKSTGLYGPHIVQVYRGVSTVELFAFLSGYWPLFAVVLLDAVLFARVRGETQPIERGLQAATLLLIAYHWLIVIPVMHYSSRFYQPTVPALAFLTARALGRFHRAFERGLGLDEARLAPLAAAAIAFLAYQLGTPLMGHGKDFFLAIKDRRWPQLDVRRHATTDGPQGYWYALDRFMKLPDDLVVATTEVGMPGVLAPKKVIVDLAGLNETEFAKKPFSAERLFTRYQPDLIYMPHSVYVTMNKDILAAPQFKGYDYYPRAELKTKDFGLAIRRDSKHYAAMAAIMRQKKPVSQGAPR